MSANAFAQRAASATTKSDTKRRSSDRHKPPERHSSPPLPVRTTLAETRTAATDTSLEVDHMILDYLAYQATNACLSSRDPPAPRTDKKKKNLASHHQHHVPRPDLASNLAMTDSFISMFQTQHPDYIWDDDIRFRLRLLQFCALFTQRWTRNPSTPTGPALAKLRKINAARARDWIRSGGVGDEQDRRPSLLMKKSDVEASAAAAAFGTVLPLPQTEIECNRAQTLEDLQVPAEHEHNSDEATGGAEGEGFYGTPGSLSLLDLLPSFMQVSADLNALLERPPTPLWMELAAEFMLQACLEQYLVRGAAGVGVVDEAFAWGPQERGEQQQDQDDDTDDDDGQAENEKNSSIELMFTSSLHSTSSPDPWPEIKHTQLTRLFNNSKDIKKHTITAHLENLSRESPPASFDARIREYLSAVSQSVPAPVLAQREKGRLDDMSRQETKEFFRLHER